MASIGLGGHNGKVEFHKPIGCGQCDNRGYSGRLAIFELMSINEDIRRLTLKKPTSDQVRELALSDGMKMMRDHAAEKVLAGLTTVEEVKRKVFIEEE